MLYIFLVVPERDANNVLPENICKVLNGVVKLVDCNPRDMKRVINLLQIIFVLGNIKPRGGPIAFSKDKGSMWKSFLKKCVLWIVLCQNFPYRMSLLVQVLLDFDQKQRFNANSKKLRNDSRFSYRNNTAENSEPELDDDMSDDEMMNEKMSMLNPNLKKLLNDSRFSYRNNTTDNSQPELDDDMSIYAFYMTYVDKFVKAFKKSDRFCRLDNDPEEFTALLQRTAHQTTATATGDKVIKRKAIKCADVLGPREKCKETKAELKITSVFTSSVPDAKEAATESEDEEARDSTFSLLSYSFNLDPAMRIEVSILLTIAVYNIIIEVYFVC